jgi:putative membrane protein
LAAARKLGIVLALLLSVLLAAVFAYNNPEPVTIDAGFARFPDVSLSLALLVCTGVGWVLGLLSAGFALWRMTAERRQLRRDLKLAEAELSSLRSLPLNDAH